MNILPKKRWHVRTKENIARVRKDEAEAAEQERQEKLRIENADREARLCLLKSKSKQKLEEFGVDIKHTETKVSSEHVNLFEDYKQAIRSTNKEHDKDIKEKSEDYEKKIGYLTYLGQDTNEALHKKNWYEVLPEDRYSKPNEIRDTYDKLVLKDKDGKEKTKLDIKDGEIAWKLKQKLDPINLFKKYCYIKSNKDSKVKEQEFVNITHGHKKKNKHKKNNDKAEKIKKLREARLKREQKERHKTEMFLKELDNPSISKESYNPAGVIPKYNSQFNPELARQNYR